MTLFAEIFPINLDAIPPLTIYKLATTGSRQINEVGRKLKYRLEGRFKRHWHWDDEMECLLTDTPQSEADLMTALTDLWNEQEEIFKESLESIALAPDLKASTKGIANFVANSLLNDVAQEIRDTLAQFTQDKGKYYISLECNRYGWVVDGHPAVSASIRSSLDYKGDLKTFINQYPNDDLIGLHVIDKTKPDFQSSMEITGVVGKLGESNRRERLLRYKLTPAMRRIIEQAGLDELVITTNEKYHYVVSALGVRIYNKDYPRFGISERLQIPSSERTKYVLPIAKILQDTGYVGSAYNERDFPQFFPSRDEIGYKPILQFGNNQTGSLENFLGHVKRFGMYKSSNNKKMRIAIVNTQPNVSLDNLKIMLRGNLDQDLGYTLISAGEKQVPNPSRATLEGAVNELAKNKPDIILAIIPRKYGDADDEEWTLYDHFKHLCLKQDIQSQVVQPQTVNNRYAIDNIILGILAKTGNIPYVLAEPISYADLIVGLDVSHRIKSNNVGTINAAAMARIYFTNGELLRYSIRDAKLEGEIIPSHVLQDIFPLSEFAGKRIIIHRDGKLPDKEKNALLKWGNDIGSEFYFVEIIKTGNPRIYDSSAKTLKAPKGSIFKLSDTEAFLVSSKFPDTFPATPQPIRVRTHPPFPLNQAIHSVLMLTLLHYGSVRPPRLPVTTFYADKISKMASKGLRPKTTDGTIPFWL